MYVHGGAYVHTNFDPIQCNIILENPKYASSPMKKHPENMSSISYTHLYDIWKKWAQISLLTVPFGAPNPYIPIKETKYPRLHEGRTTADGLVNKMSLAYELQAP